MFVATRFMSASDAEGRVEVLSHIDRELRRKREIVSRGDMHDRDTQTEYDAYCLAEVAIQAVIRELEKKY